MNAPNINFQKMLDERIAEITASGRTPTLLLHCCCAPCSSYVLEYLTEHFLITAHFYNPNISEKAEYDKRASELRRLISEQPHRYPVTFTSTDSPASIRTTASLVPSKFCLRRSEITS